MIFQISVKKIYKSNFWLQIRNFKLCLGQFRHSSKYDKSSLISSGVEIVLHVIKKNEMISGSIWTTLAGLSGG